MKSMPVGIDFKEHGLQARDLMLGIEAFGASRAYLYEQVLGEKVVKDFVGGEAVLLVVGPDNESVRAFRNRDGADFYRIADGTVMDAATGSKWNFQGCTASGKCLERIPMLKDYWFDWRNYHPGTSVYGKK